MYYVYIYKKEWNKYDKKCVVVQAHKKRLKQFVLIINEAIF